MNVFISQPMRGKTNEEIQIERDNALKNIKEEYKDEVIIILDTFFNDFDTNTSPLKFLARSIDKLAEADVAIFIGDWKNYRGCNIENICCKEYGIDTKYFS